MRGFRWRPVIDEQHLLNHEHASSSTFSVMTTNAMLVEETHLTMGQGERREVSDRISGGRLANVRYVRCEWVSGREGRKPCVCLLSAAVTVLYVTNDSLVLSRAI